MLRGSFYVCGVSLSDVSRDLPTAGQVELWQLHREPQEALVLEALDNHRRPPSRLARRLAPGRALARQDLRAPVNASSAENAHGPAG